MIRFFLKPPRKNSANRNAFASELSCVYEKISRICGPSYKSRDTCSLVSRIVNQEARSRRRYDSRGDKGLPGLREGRPSYRTGKPVQGSLSLPHSRIRLIAERSVAVPMTYARRVWPKSSESTAIYTWRVCRQRRGKVVSWRLFRRRAIPTCRFSRINFSNADNDV